ncbi:MAG TPA: hypothetical protein VNQ32_01520 [Steroidobacteraceae bacterium]|nr:hypothetical protein [Steroidobacteraceae bacterium]
MLESWHTPDEAGSLRMDRRVLLTVSGALVMAAATTGTAQGRPSPDGLSVMDSRPTVILQDRRVLLPEDLRARLGGSTRVLQLEADPVRMWRGEHAPLLGDPTTRLVGITPWIEFVMIQGLAAESRRRVRYQRHDAGADAMVWLIA